MDITEKAAAVERVFEDLDERIGSFMKWSTLGCKWGCGKCCYKPDIEATALEFLPLALHLYRRGEAEIWMERLQSTDDPICMALQPQQTGAGLCGEYRHRGLICRLFGFSARTNKYGENELVTCGIIKTEQAQAYETAAKEIAKGGDVPVMSRYYMQLHSIDFEMAREFFPINKAILRAIQTILHYYAYRS